ncbi:beta-lactamase family protein [Pseudoxanthomonas sp. F37]|uniref:serine hydrolase domain-containing protein n=1 Tax=Pseudoxanthomonas TaxID=83618 RepID=UPI001FD6B199|nr:MULTISPECIES: serine hydrolase domain-containing protein [Pseudoxanthomonas]UOV07020.1 beta-lactamase family protein [Pseudoxanthomonas mexicana]UOV10490.1 beta-lactamase family protein [Pseudoxanthomonas sp. F37]
MAMMSTGAHAATRAETIDAWMRDYTGQVPGASVLVLLAGEPVFQRSYGLADLEAGVASSPATNYRLASVSKQFTAASVLLLVQDGALTLDDPVRRWLPSLPVAAKGITLHHLLSHTSGLVDYEDLLPPDQARQVRDADVLHLLEREDRLYFPAGSDYRYSNSGYALLALVVERASGQRFSSFLRTRIFSPLGMTATLAREDEGPPVPDRAFGYSLVGDRWDRTDQSTTSAVLGDGGIYSSITDLAKWDAAWYDDRLLSAQSRALATQAATATPETDVAHYGYGWRLQGRMQWHSGESIGFRNVLLRFPAQHLTVIVLSNRDAPEPYRLARRIAALWNGVP